MISTCADSTSAWGVALLGGWGVLVDRPDSWGVVSVSACGEVSPCCISVERGGTNFAGRCGRAPIRHQGVEAGVGLAVSAWRCRLRVRLVFACVVEVRCRFLGVVSTSGCGGVLVDSPVLGWVVLWVGFDRCGVDRLTRVGYCFCCQVDRGTA